MALRIFHYLIPSSHYVLLSLVFFAGLELTLAFHRWIIPMASVFFLLLAIGIMLVRIEEKGRFRTTQAILPILAMGGLTLFSVFLPVNQFIHGYFMLASILLFWLLKHATKLAYPTWNWTMATLVLFVNTASIIGLRFHLYLPVLLILSLIFIVAFLISFQAIRRLTPRVSDTLFIAVALALSLAEIAWTLQFTPLHYVVQAGVIVAFYYVFFHLISVSYERRIVPKDITEYAIVGSLALLIILLTARWK